MRDVHRYLHTNIAYISNGAGTRSVILTRPCVVAAFVNSRAFFAGHDAIPPECIILSSVSKNDSHRHTDRHTDTHTDRQTDTQTHRHADIPLQPGSGSAGTGAKSSHVSPCSGEYVSVSVAATCTGKRKKTQKILPLYNYSLARFCLCRFSSKV